MKRTLQLVTLALLTLLVFGRNNVLSAWFHGLLDGAGTLFSWFLVGFLYVNLFHWMFIKTGTARIATRYPLKTRRISIWEIVLLGPTLI